MPKGLRRVQQEGDDHFIPSVVTTAPLPQHLTLRDLFLNSPEQTRKRYKFQVLGYVIMP